MAFNLLRIIHPFLSLAWFLLLLFVIIFINSSYISALHSTLKFFKVSVFASLSYKYVKIRYFHGQCKVSGLVTNEISYVLIYVT